MIDMTIEPLPGVSPDLYEIFVRTGARGDGASACRVGDAYRTGEWFRYSPRQAFRWYAMSALAGDARGQNNLGACYQHGIGCAQSYPKALKWYLASAAQDCGTATMNLGFLYLRGHAVPENRAEAIRLFRVAVKQGEPAACDELERLGESRPLDDPDHLPDQVDRS